MPGLALLLVFLVLPFLLAVAFQKIAASAATAAPATPRCT